MMMIRCILSALVAMLPAVVFVSLVFLTFEDGAYYTRPWQLVAIVFFVASFLLGLRIPVGRQTGKRSLIRERFFVYPAMAWMLAVGVLFGLSFTPLVLGQDNGDGANGYAECWFFAISSSLVYSGFVFLLILLNALVATSPFFAARYFARNQSITRTVK